MLLYSASPGIMVPGEIIPGFPGLSPNSPPQATASILISYNILTEVLANAIMEWNIGIPVSGQIRQTSQDRTDFAY
jgi:hypothetical protein